MRAYPDLVPLLRVSERTQVLVKALAAARKMGWRDIVVDKGAFRIEGVAVTPLLRFRDDVVVEVRPHSPGSAVHVRSKSRLGKADFGANAARIRAFLTILAKNIT